MLEIDKTLFILDASGFVFRSYFALPSMTSPSGETVQGVFGFIRSFNKLCKEFLISHVVAVFDGPNNKESRKNLYADYKANRTRRFEDLPGQITFIKEFGRLIGLSCVEVDGVEADDVIGSIAKFAENQGFRVYIFSADKDLFQLVNENIRIVNPWKNNLILSKEEIFDLYRIPPENIADYLALVGDSSDNIPGVKGCGPKGAVELLNRFGSVEALLASLDSVESTKQLDNIKNHKEILALGKKLATIDVAVPFSIDSDMFAFSCDDSNKHDLYSFYRKMGFTSLIGDKKEKREDYSEKRHWPQYKNICVDQVNLVLDTLADAPYLSFVIDYTGHFLYDLQVFGICLCGDQDNIFYVSKDIFHDFRDFTHFVETVLSGKILVGFSVKNDIHALKMISEKSFRIDFDIAVANYLLHMGDKEFDLQDIAKMYLNSDKEYAVFAYKNYKRETISVADHESYEFLCSVVETNFLLFPVLKQRLEEKSLLFLFESLEMPLMAVLSAMEDKGIFIRVEELQVLEQRLKKELNLLEKKIYDLATESFNINSSKQLARVLFDVLKLTPVGSKLSTKAEILETLVNEHPVISEILTYRTLEKLRSTYVTALPKQINPKTGCIHPTFVQTLTATGRLACQSPNLQNIPIKTDLGLSIRHAFCPRAFDRQFISFDYSQIELRFLAHFSDDPAMIKAFFSGQDIHTFTAAEIFRLPLSEVTKEHRRQAKVMNFGLIYGQQAYGLSKILKIGLQRAKDLMASYFSRYPHIRDYLESVMTVAEVEGKSYTLLGHERKITGFHSQNSSERNAARRLAVNTPMQGSAADLIKLAMVKIHTLFLEKKMRSYMILQIHDELIFEIFPDEEEILVPEIKKIMETAMTLRVPLVANIAIGKNWAEC